MNLIQFLKETDGIAGKMTRGQLAAFLHEYARMMPEEERESYLSALREAQRNPDTEKTGMQETQRNSHAGEAETQERASEAIPGGQEDPDHAQLLEQCRKISRKLSAIENWELCLTGSLNEEYDEWYNSEEEEFLYEDPDGVGDVIAQACVLAHQCVSCGEYAMVCEMAEILVGLEIMVGGGYQEYTDEPMSVAEMGHHGLGQFDYRQFVLDALYAVYRIQPSEYRAEKMFEIMENARVKVTLEMVLQNGAELPDIEVFLRQWAVYLGGIIAGSSQRLLEEAMEMIGDPEFLLESANVFSRQHPGLYEMYFLENADRLEPEECISLGKAALESISIRYKVRSRIALMLAGKAMEGGMREEAEKFWLEAFRSNTNVENFLRLFLESRDFSKFQPEVRKIYLHVLEETQKKGYRFSSSGELKENLPDPNMVYLIGFFCGEFSDIRNRAMNKEYALGWSTTFMKCGISAFLLLLYQGETLQQGGKEMCDRLISEAGFSKDLYQRGTLQVISETDRDWFWNCFCRWKKTVTLTEEEINGCLSWIRWLVEKRVDGIMNASRRNYYQECAAFVAALGEAVESNGEIGGKQRVMREFMDLYHRRSAFRAEMRGFGMLDGKP